MKIIRACLVLILLVFSGSIASQSGSFSDRSAASFRAGNFTSAILLAQRAILASRKEANVKNENFANINMAHLLNVSRDYFSADSFLNQVLESEELLTQQLVLLERVRSKKGQGKYSEALELLESAKNNEDEERIQKIYGQLLLEKAELLARLGEGDPNSVINQASELLEKAPGKINWSKARVLFFEGSVRQALDVYLKALEQSSKGHVRPQVAGSILFEMGICSEKLKERKAATVFYRRSMDAFEQAELGLPFVRSGTKYLSLEPGDKVRSGKVAQARNEFAGKALDFLLQSMPSAQ